MKTINMTQGKPIGLLLRFSLPLIVGNILQQLYSIVDTAIVGQGVGIHALAAVGAADWLNWFVLWIVQGLTLGFSVLISQKYGAGDRKGLKKTVAMSAFLCIAIGILLTIAGEAAAMPALRMLNTPESIIDGALLYLKIIYGGILIIMAYNMASCILRALGDSKTPMYAIAIATVVNITLDLLFVMVFQMSLTHDKNMVLRKGGDVTDPYILFALEAWDVGGVNALKNWILGGMQVTDEDMIKRYRLIIPDILTPYFKEADSSQ